MKEPIPWLLQEIPDLVKRGVLTEDVAERLRKHYAPRIEESGAWGRRAAVMVLGVLGALLVGAGVILVLAHNWDGLSRPVRATLSIGMLLAGQALAGWTLLRRRDSAVWRESSACLLTLAIGACIALVSQTYHISGETQDFLFVWTVLALPLMYVMESRIGAALSCAGITAWACSEIFRSGETTLFWLLAIATVPYLIHAARHHGRDARTTLLFWVVALSLPLACASVLSHVPGHVWIPVYAGLLGAFLALGASGGGEREGIEIGPWRRPFRFVGYFGIVVFSLVLTYEPPWKAAGNTVSNLSWIGALQDVVSFAFVVPLSLALAASAFAVVQGVRWARNGRWHLTVAAAVPVPAFVLWVAARGLGGGSSVLCAAFFDIYLLVLGLITTAFGLKEGRIFTTNEGLLAVAALVIARFFDSDWSFLVRGLAFIALGLGFLVANLVLLARRRKNTLIGEPS